MDFYAECEKQKQRRMGLIGEASYRRQQAARAIADHERTIREADEAIAAHEEVLHELDRVQRNFKTHQALEAGAEQEADESAPPGAGAD